VQRAAGALENAIRRRLPEQDVEAARHELAAHLRPLTEEIARALAATTPAAATASAASPPVDAARSREAAAQLLVLLSDSDPGAADFVETHRAALGPLFASAAWGEFEARVQGYAFADAHTQLEQALTTFAATESPP
jgi:hypothetical protein